MKMNWSRDPRWDGFEQAAAASLAATTVWRGQWGAHEGLRSDLPTLAFGSKRTAEGYSANPNDRKLAEGQVIEPRLFEVRLCPGRIYARSETDHPDQFLDLDVIGTEFGRDVVRAIARDWGDAVEQTSAYDEMNHDHGLDLEGMIAAWPEKLHYLPPVPGYLALRVPEFVSALKEAGYDAVMVGGSGANAMEAEFHALDPDIVRDPQTGDPVAVWREEETFQAPAF